MLRLVRFKATYRVLLIICLMYLVTYIDRVNIGTAAPAMQKETRAQQFRARPRLLGLRLSLRVLPDRRRLLGDRLGPRMTL